MNRAHKEGLLLVLPLLLASCVRSPTPPPAPLEEDESIRFPKFHVPTVNVDAEKQPYEIDGTLLRAIEIAANDFLPVSSPEQPCWWKKEAHRYRVIRQGNVIFVQIDEDLAYCGRQYPALDSGAAYAISADGRILRRLIGSQTGELLGVESSGRGILVPNSEVGSSQVQLEGPSPYLPLAWQDAGPRSVPAKPSPAPSTGPDGGVSGPNGGPAGMTRDAGT